MNKCFYILLFVLIIFSSCSESSIDTKECIAYVSTSFSSTDISLFAVDENTVIIGHRQEGSCLVLDTQFPGGCEEHALQLLIDDDAQSNVGLNTAFPAILSHNNTDQCEGLVALEVHVDISRLALLQLDVINLDIEDYASIVELTF